MQHEIFVVEFGWSGKRDLSENGRPGQAVITRVKIADYRCQTIYEISRCIIKVGRILHGAKTRDTLTFFMWYQMTHPKTVDSLRSKRN